MRLESGIPPQVLVPPQADPIAADVCDRWGTGDKTEEPRPLGESKHTQLDFVTPQIAMITFSGMLAPQVGAKYESENEEELKDQMDFTKPVQVAPHLGKPCRWPVP